MTVCCTRINKAWMALDFFGCWTASAMRCELWMQLLRGIWIVYKCLQHYQSTQTKAITFPFQAWFLILQWVSCMALQSWFLYPINIYKEGQRHYIETACHVSMMSVVMRNNSAVAAVCLMCHNVAAARWFSCARMVRLLHMSLEAKWTSMASLLQLSWRSNHTRCMSSGSTSQVAVSVVEIS